MSLKVLVLAPHPDDEAIGCGGTICLHRARGHSVSVVFLSSGEGALKRLPRNEAWAVREAEARAACAVLDAELVSFLRQPDWFVGDNLDAAVDALTPVVQEHRPDLMYLPHPLEWHPDHQACLPIVRRALARANLPATSLLLYEVWTPMSTYDHVEDITCVMRRKLTALRCHVSQIGHFRYDRATRGLSQYRGALAARCGFAEVFHTASVVPDA
jgi:LmbE family N-acetylglucosaminyl deacetylase